MRISRRRFVALSGGLCAAMALGDEISDRPALIAITLDLEMARNFPRWEDTEWDYRKGDLTPEAKDYTLAVCERVKQRGGVVHTFVVGQTLEQPNVDWLKRIAGEGHKIGNHTYDHVNVLAKDLASLQFRFQRAPWLVRDKSPIEVIRENIAMTSAALESRVGIKPSGFRTPGGFADGLNGREDIQQLLLDVGFSWTSSRYPSHSGIEDLHGTGRSPSKEAFEAIVAAQRAALPFVYGTGLVEVPMSPISDIVAFRGGRWKLDDFLHAVASGVQWAIENRACYDFLAHPSCLGVVDPQMRTVDLICDLVEQSDGRARIVDLGIFASRAKVT